MKLNLKNKRLCIFGLPGSGKSNLLSYIASAYGAGAFIYDTMHEYPANHPYGIYRPKDRYSVPEMERVISRIIKLRSYTLVALDEANRFAPSKPHPLPAVLGEINDCCRHPQYGFTPVFLSRRPTQLNQDLTELSHYLVIFTLKGKNDVDYLNDFSRGLGETTFNLALYHFLVVNERREWVVHKPVPLMGLFGRDHTEEIESPVQNQGG